MGLTPSSPLNGCRAVVFDLDGTLADTVGDIALALNRTLAEFDLAPHPEKLVRGMVGGGLAKLFDRALARHQAELGPEHYDAALARLLENYAAHPCENSRLYPGAREILASLSAAGFACGVLTNKHEPIARNVVAGLGIAASFKKLRGANAGFPRKPDPAGLLDVLETLDARPETTLMVGDSENDLTTARAAALKVAVLVTHGYSSVPVTQLGADAVINHLHELVEDLALPAEEQ